MILLCEEEGIVVDETLVGQYLYNERIVKEFTAYYELYNKYKKDYKVEEILAGTNSAQEVERARIAKFDERLSLLGMLLDKLESGMRENLETSDYLKELMKVLKIIKTLYDKDSGEKEIYAIVESQLQARKKLIETMSAAGTLSDEDRKKNRAIIRFLEACEKELRLLRDENPFDLLKRRFDEETAAMKAENAKLQERLHNVFAFSEVAFMDGNEMLVLVTELTVNVYSARFIGLYGSEDYAKHSEDLMLHEREDDILQEIENLDL